MTEIVERRRTYNLLPDKPAEEDRFGGEGHQRSAKALAAAIKKLANEDGAIGIEGGWGSGKSTVVGFAEQLLSGAKGPEEYQVFTFDLWAHGMHDIRRPLLEELVAWADREGLLGDKNKNKTYFQDKIRDRNETITKTFSRRYNFAGFVAIFLAPIIPLALAWLSPFALRGWSPIQLHESNTIDTWIIHLVPWFWVVALGVFVLLYANFIIQALFKGVSNALSIYESKSEVETEKRNIRRRDPATTEFHQIFREILSEIQTDKRRLVLVLDNIDRIAEGRLRETWAEVRSVFAAHEPGAETPIGRKAVTCIVPYDLKYVAEGFTQTEPISSSSGLSSSSAAEALIRKTFKTIIRVSPPIAADWQEYFYFQLDEAMEPGLEPAQKYRLFKMYEIERRILGHPTPRDIINYVNEIVIHAEQWEDQIPLEAISLYLACRSKLADKPQAIIQDALVSEYAVGVSNLGPDWRRFVAALFYNVEPGHSERVMLEYRLNDSLVGEAEPDFSVMSKLPNFGSSLSDVVKAEARGWAKSSVEVMDRAARRIGGLILDDYQLSEIWRELGSVLPDLSEVFTHRYSTYEGLHLIAARQPTHQQARDVGLSLIEKFRSHVDRNGPRKAWEGAYWFAGVESVLDSVASAHSRKLALEIASRVKFPNHVEAAVEACEQAGDGHDRKWRLAEFGNAPSEGTHAETLKEWFGSRPEAVLHVLRSEPPFLTQQVLVDTALAMIERLQNEPLSENGARAQVVGVLMEAVAQLPRLNLIGKQTTGFFDQGFAIWHVGAAIEAKDWEAAAELIWFAASYRQGDLNLPSVPEVPNLGSIGNRAQLYSEHLTDVDAIKKFCPPIAELSQRRKQFDAWQSYALADTDSNLKKAVYQSLIDLELYGGFSFYKTVVEFEIIKNILDETLLRRLLNWMDAHAEDLDERFFGEGALKISPAFIREVANREVAGLNKYGEAIDAYLRQLTSENWSEAIEEDATILDRLCLRIATAKFSPRAIPFREAIISHLVRIARGDGVNSPSREAWAEILKAIEKRSFDRLVKDFCLSLNATAVTGEGAGQLVHLVPGIVNSSLEGAGAGTVVSKVITPLLLADLTAAAALIKAADVHREAVSESDREALAGTVEDMLRDDLPDDDRQKLNEICIRVGISMPEKRATNESDGSTSETDE